MRMKAIKNSTSQTVPNHKDRIEENTIILHAVGEFPKDVIIIETDGRKRRYRLQKTRNGGYLLN